MFPSKKNSRNKYIFLMIYFILVIMLFSCNSSYEENKLVVTLTPGEKILALQSGFSHHYQQLQIGVGGIGKQKYTTTEGTTRKRLIVQLWIIINDHAWNTQVIDAYVGQELEVENYHIRILEIQENMEYIKVAVIKKY